MIMEAKLLADKLAPIMSTEFYPLNEKWSAEDKVDVKGKLSRSKKIPKEMKEKIEPLVSQGSSEYNNGRVFGLRYSENKGCSLGADKSGFFVYTHRARSKSYPTVEDIPQKDIKFIESTG